MSGFGETLDFFEELQRANADLTARAEELGAEVARLRALLETGGKTGYEEGVQDVANWLRVYAEKQSGEHPGNAGYIACQAAANRLKSGEWKDD